MKNLIFTIALGSILLTSCSKDESFEPTSQPVDAPIYVLEQDSNSGTFTSLFPENGNLAPEIPNTNFGVTSGLFEPTRRDPLRISWSGLTDGTGTYGTAELQVRTPTYTMHIIMEAECIVVEGSKAVFGGHITQVLELTGNTPDISPMWRFYFQVEDQGTLLEDGYGTDSISNKWIFASPRSISLCSVYSPNHRIWSSNGYAQVINPGHVEVSDHPQ